MGRVSSGVNRLTQFAWLSKNSSMVAAILVLLALAVSISVLAGRLATFPGDRYVMSLAQSIQLPLFDELMRGVTYLGYIIPVVVLAVLVAGAFWGFGHHLEATFIVLALSGQLVSAAIKALVQRPRPTLEFSEDWLVGANSSFPSAHALHFMVFFGLLIYLARAKVEQGWLRIIIYLASGTLIALVGVSRVYLRAHWPSDVLGGYVIGALWLIILIRAYRAMSQRQ